MNHHTQANPVKVRPGSLCFWWRIPTADLGCIQDTLVGGSPECIVEKKPETYKPTMLDRDGPDAGTRLRAYAYGVMVFGITLAALIFTIGPGVSRFSVWQILGALLLPLVLGAIVAGVAKSLSNVAGASFKHLMVDGASTPYKEQYSYQQALVMQGRLDEALESFEAVIAEKPDSVDARVKAAELYARSKGNHVRAAELFREIQRIPSVSPGEYIYATNRLVDLLTGPLQELGRALVELRRLIERYPASAAAEHARVALAELKARTPI